MHTPGPWTTVPPDRCIYHPDGKRVIAVAQHDCPEVQANAKLIAAAPALLEALERVTNYYGTPPLHNPADDEADSPWALARAAIKEAK